MEGKLNNKRSRALVSSYTAALNWFISTSYCGNKKDIKRQKVYFHLNGHFQQVKYSYTHIDSKTIKIGG